MNNSLRKKVLLVFFAGLVLLALLEAGLIRLIGSSYSAGAWQTAIALVMMLGGWGLVIWSVRTLYVQGGGTPAPVAETQRLVRAGPYRFTRNPMTLGAALFYLGLAVWASSWIVFGLVMLVFVFLLIYIYNHETRELSERFGVEYLNYRNEIPFLFPRIPH